MKKIFSVIPLFLTALIFLVSSCGSSRSFSSRKYTAGNYMAHKHKIGKVSEQEAPEHEAGQVAKNEALKEKTLAAEHANQFKEELRNDKIASEMVHADAKVSSSDQSPHVKKTVREREVKTKRFKTERFKQYISDKAVRSMTSTDEGDDGSLDPGAVVSFILGVLGLACNIFVITLIFATGAEYIFILLLIGGLILGVIALVCGIRGLRKHHEKNGSTLNLIFSIIGTVLGAVTVIPTFILVLFMLLLSL